MKNLYKVLGIEKSATQKEIKQAYRKLASLYHPDRNKEESAKISFQFVKEAYDILSDEEKRKEYDETGILSNDPLRAGAIELIFDVFLYFLSLHEYEEKNYIPLISEHIMKGIAECKDDINHINKQIKALTNISNNMDTNNLLDNKIQTTLILFKQNKLFCENGLEGLNTSLKLINNCKWLGPNYLPNLRDHFVIFE